MTLRLNGATSGYTEIDAPAVAGSNTLVLPTGAGSANQFLKNGSTAGSLGWSSLVEDSAGRCGIGTSSPNSVLHIEAPEGTAQLTIGNTALAASDGDFLAGIDFHIKDNNDTTGAVCTSIRSIANQNHTLTAKGTALAFSTTTNDTTTLTERMRIGANGSVQIGSNAQLATEILRVTSSNTWGAAIEANGNVSGDRALYLSMGTNTNNTSSYFIDCTTATVGPKFYVYGNGTYGTVSDANLKKNIETARDGYLDDIQKLRVVKYNWKTDDDGAPKELGWIAQELAEVFPGLVKDSQPDADGNTVKEVKTSVLQFMLLKALQEAAAKIESLEARLTALEVTP